MKDRKHQTIALCIMALLAGGTCALAQSSEQPTLVNFIVDLDLPSHATPDQVEAAKSNVINIFNEMNSQKMGWNLFLTKDATEQTRLLLAQLVLGNELTGTVELGISGNHSNENLSAKSYSEQQSILKESMRYVEACKICGVNEVHPYGFLPQSFNQNEDTYKALDNLGLEYNTGFQAGILYAPGHEKDVWPYKVENHKFYAVPVSTYDLSGELVPLNDRYATDKGISASQWKDMLIGKFNKISGKDEPMIIGLSTSLSGSGEYLDALKQFIAFASSNNAKFVGSRDLVNMSRIGIHEFSEGMSAEIIQNTEGNTTNTSSGCPACDAAKNAGLNVSNEPTQL